ncbi:MAG: exodeoxyribonuclease III [Dichotomicrobium sp.]
MILRLATWNINSVRLRLPLVQRFVAEYRPDVLCLQETKCPNDLFPLGQLAELGLSHAELHGEKGYNGVAVLSRLPMSRVVAEDLDESGHTRHIAVRLAAPGVQPVLHNFYVPAGGDIPDPDANPKFRQKLDYLQAMTRWLANPATDEGPTILAGDLNVAPLETDVWSHKQMLKIVSHTPVEVDHLTAVQNTRPWLDAVRRFVPPEEKLYTWWSYRARDWRASDRGRRLDHIWTTPDLEARAKGVEVVKDARGWDKPSDHVPVILDIDLG